MSLYSVTVNSTGIGRAGTSKILAIGFFSHISDAKKEIEAWVTENYVGPINIEVDFVSHSNTIYTADVLQYERIVIIE